MLRKKGQSTLEYCVLIIVLLGALLTIQNYFKRGIQGRWKAAVDDLGDQYDPRVTNTDIRHGLAMNSETRIRTVPGQSGSGKSGVWTLRDEAANSAETKTGFSRVGGF